MIVIITLLLRFLLLAIMTPTQGLPALRGHTAHARLAGQVGSLGGEAGVGRGSGRGRRTWVMRNLVRRSGSRPFSLERIDHVRQPQWHVSLQRGRGHQRPDSERCLHVPSLPLELHLRGRCGTHLTPGPRRGPRPPGGGMVGRMGGAAGGLGPKKQPGVMRVEPSDGARAWGGPSFKQGGTRTWDVGLGTQEGVWNQGP